MIISESRYLLLLQRGKNIFKEMIGGEVNVLCNTFIWSKIGTEHRRESDFNEMCVALALLEEKILKSDTV